MLLIRSVLPHEAPALRSLRLRALRESPRAYFSSWEDEAALPLSHWLEWTSQPSKVMFVAFDAEDSDDWLGMAGAFDHPAKPGTVSLWWLWVDPVARGKGLARRLYEALAEWARSRGATRLELAIAEDNLPSQALCRGLGFRPTGERRTMASDPTRAGIFLELNLIN